jgi:hypothetical protein
VTSNAERAIQMKTSGSGKVITYCKTEEVEN